jgi:hypothetical protein
MLLAESPGLLGNVLSGRGFVVPEDVAVKSILAAKGKDDCISAEGFPEETRGGVRG